MTYLENVFKVNNKLNDCIEVYNANNKNNQVNTSNLKAVLYTDGGCISSTISGWGIHGYIYADHETNSNSCCKQAVPTNTGYKPSAKENKVPVVAYLNYSGYETYEVTNNTAEIKAAIKAFELINNINVNEVLILADSMYVLTLLINYQKYLDNGFKSSSGKPLANQNMVKELISLYTEIKDLIKIELKHVKGHSGDYGNTQADKLCTNMMTRLRNKVNNVDFVVDDFEDATVNHDKEFFRMETPEDFFSVEESASKMLSEACLFFTTNGITTTHQKRYYQGSFGERLKSKKNDEKKIFRGKPFADVCLSVVELNKPDLIINNLVNIFSNSFLETGVVELKLNYQTKASVYNGFIKGEINNLLVDTKQHRLVSTDKTELAALIHPPRLSFKLMNEYNIVSGMLDELRSGLSPYIKIVADVTNLFYEITDKKGKQTFKLIDNEEGVVHVPIEFDCCETKKQTIIPLTLGVDLPNKISLGRLKQNEPKISLFIFDIGPRTLRYGTYIETDEGYGIWMGIYSNVHLH